MNDKAMKYIIALLSSLILTSCSMFNNEAPYKRFLVRKNIPLFKPCLFALYLIVYSSL